MRYVGSAETVFHAAIEKGPSVNEPPEHREERISRATAGRLSLYLRCLESRLREGQTKISSSDLAETLGITDSQVRKDLSQLGSLGKRGIGYTIVDLIRAIRESLGIDRTWRAALIGIGNLARALLRYRGFHARGFEIVGLFDSDTQKIGSEVDGQKVLSLQEMPATIETEAIRLAILTVPANAAQGIVDRLASTGIRGVLNFAPTVLKMPSNIQLVSVDFTIQLEQLAFRVHLGEDENTLADIYPIV
ncbi:redox-sensing transcriptional repressor Rex [Tuwongella immobilis]|uniref:Redox-sensing transcriptional repressor Rex n=1 Tax=Tuwongella immobilis TaxID=692036 RepID=A0A6C2YPL9_9BACT|nr:redox-sensing transcriptional repressor Rex [Tuwongella immobilis]VIP03568.1 redox-sensing transcriptional repressor rex : Redox-sensing transcriptional repressor Rex OS=Singulisphaera acidiphila (strain ATCC BAA-1392 / DSM 18658 / VKM B-2454 / MOB10) GN=rex PE=3 SV=1: Put_DNA-bind_N: CoA_binding [Tuwongella immobilis]VTS04504.1 redox-sensing transcriptional repressor rex : Redox-sensing transcriptional repressor Rex OS=Singulisphaera acidiphila (strain ATCC BAA-1392 / DSM 18658 / VKM B-2454 /